MQVRLCLGWGGDGTTHAINVLKDTGSDLLTLFYEDLPYLGNNQQYEGWQQEVDVQTAGGNVERLLTLLVEVRLLRPVTSIAWGDWVEELAMLRERVPGIDRLSGVRMRSPFFFGTRPGNLQVAVSSTKGFLKTRKFLMQSCGRSRKPWPLQCEKISTADNTLITFFCDSQKALTAIRQPP